ncbi:MAG: NAD(P)H-hydrate dehydratase [Lachnospiraceae bacterium]|nr:NAD(P)H-hydrate dehydratase [Candidatus Minthocola equi]
MKKVELLTEEHLTLIPARDPSGNKGSFGRVLVIAGSRCMAGAAYLSATAAYRAGAGLVHIFTPEDNRIILQTLVPEAVMTTYDCKHVDISLLSKAVEKADSIVIGPGLGTSEAARELLHFVLFTAEQPTCIDADALNIISQSPGELGLLGEKHLLTPHVKEFSRLAGVSVDNIKKDPAGQVAKFADMYNTNVVLKDADTHIATCNGKLYKNTFGNCGMGTGGSGDVLSGIIGALLAIKELDIGTAGALGVLIHALAGDAAAAERSERSIMARDLLEYIR